MKKTKLLMPVLAVAAFGATTMPLIMTSCSKEETEIFNISDDGVLLGFKGNINNGEIQKQCGETLTIPKKVKRIANYAFVNNAMDDTTIPSFIENLEFEDGYQCKEIGSRAFAYAPFKRITITCERNQPDGKEHTDPDYWRIPHEGSEYTGWGLRQIDDKAFFQNKNLTYLKLPGTMGIWGKDCFACKNDEGEYFTNLSTIDMSDWTVLDIEGGKTIIPNYEKLWGGPDIINNWPGKLILRWHDAIYGPDRRGRDEDMKKYLNMWQEAFGSSHISQSFDDRHVLCNISTIEWWGEPDPE